MCIYYGNIPGLTYEKREHIFPAGLGGKTMLPKGYVSDQANELFSPLELGLMHNSTISIMRSMEGPGKRGSLNPQKASTSEICKYESDDGTIELGYIKAGKPYSIPQLHIDKSKTQFHFISPRDGNDATETLDLFKRSLSNFSGKFVSIHINELGSSAIIVGVWKDKFYIAYGETMPDVQFLSDQISLFCQKAKVGGVSQRDTHGKFELHLMESPDFCRVYAKIAYNVLAFSKGEQFVLDSRFDRVRNWILGKEDISDFNSLPQGFSRSDLPIFPESAHFCLFMHCNDKLVAFVCLYGVLLHTFEFSDWNPLLDSFPFPGFLGFICDWKREEEYTMNDWIRKLAKGLF